MDSENLTPYILEINNLTKTFSLEEGFFSRKKNLIYALNKVNLKVKKGEIVGIVGESGSGKTTLSKLIVRLYQGNEGNILFNGEEIAKYDKRKLKLYREKVKYIYQDPSRSLNPRMSIFNILTDGLLHSSTYEKRADKSTIKKEIQEKAVKIIEEVGLKEKDLYKKPVEFSGGQRQRISIARALIMTPSIVLCDEVVSALDVSIQGQIINLLLSLKTRYGLTYLFITHDLKIASYFCDRILVMYKGIVVEEGEGNALYKEALHPYTALLFKGAAYDIGNLTSNSTVLQANNVTLTKDLGCPYCARCQRAGEECKIKLPELQRVSDKHSVRCCHINKTDT